MKDDVPSASLLAEAANIDTPLERLDELARERALMPIVAANPAASSETLEKLAAQKDVAVRRALAGNPNTPMRHLLALAQEFPGEFLSNPVLPLLNLSQPDFIKSLPQGGWLQMLRHDRVPSIWLKWAQQGFILPLKWQRREVVEELQFHVAIAGEATRGWERRARKALQEDPRLLSYFYYIDTQKFLLSLLAFPGLAPQWGVELRAARKELQGLVLAHSPELNSTLLALLARDPTPAIRCAVARHPRTPGKVLSKLVDRASDSAFRRAVASNTQIPGKLLRRLAGDEDATVRVAVAHHPRATVEMLETLALDTDFTVRTAVASHPRLSLEIYQLLANDFDSSVRARLARNVHVPLETLLALAKDARREVRVALARNPRLPLEGFTLLFQDASPQVRASLASNPRLPLPLLEQLAASRDPAIRRGLAANPRTPLVQLEAWLEEGISAPSDPLLCLALARNPRATPAMLTTLAEPLLERLSRG
jgi:hypothetical protein